MKCPRWIVLLLAMSVAAGWAYAQPTRGPQTVTAQDYADIQHLVARYAQGTDFDDASMWLSVFSADGVLSLGPGRDVVGQQALAEYFRTVRQSPRPKRRHWNSNLVVTPTAEGASARVYLIQYDVSEKQPSVATIGYYDDILIRTADGWRIRRRAFSPFYTPDAPGAK